MNILPGKLIGVFWAASIGVMLSAASPGHADGDPMRGEEVFRAQCSTCHSVKAGKNKIGPSLFAVVGRKAGSVPGFAYSDAMKNYGVVWTPDRIDAYITNPRAILPSVKMSYAGLADEKARADVIAFLTTQR